jgi:hypothetical protein
MESPCAAPRCGYYIGRSAPGVPAIAPLRKISLLPLLALLLAASSSCGRSGPADGALSVRLAYPPAGPSASPTASPSAHPASSAFPSASPTDPGDRILIRVLAPHFTAIEAWFTRSAGRGVIGGVPPGARISVEVDEYDPTGTVLLYRGWSRGVTLSQGEAKTVEVTMHAKGAIVTVCGAAASAGEGASGDSGDGGLDNAALLGYPSAVKAGPDDSIYVSSSAYGRVRRIDRYGYVSHFAGNGGYGAVSAGDALSSAPVGHVADIDFDPAGNVYLLTYFNQVVKAAGGVITSVMHDNGTYSK